MSEESASQEVNDDSQEPDPAHRTEPGPTMGGNKTEGERKHCLLQREEVKF